MSSSPMAKTYSFNTLQQASEYFLKQGWTDGLPINLPTEHFTGKTVVGASFCYDEDYDLEPFRVNLIKTL